MSDTQQQEMDIESLAAESQRCHADLAEQRQRVEAAFELFRRSSASYYVMCSLESNQENVEAPHQVLLALGEFKRQGLLQFDDKTVNKLSTGYVRAMKVLKQEIDKSVELTDRLAQLTQMEQKVHLQQATKEHDGNDALAMALDELDAEEPI